VVAVPFGMMPSVAATVFVESAADRRLADYRALTDVELRRRLEPAHGIFIAEGELVIGRALAAGYPILSALTSQRWLARLLELAGDADVPVFVGSVELLEQITGFHVHRGALAAMGRRPLPTTSDLLRASTRVVVLEAVNSHTNLGAIFRSAAGLGMDAVLLSPSCADPLYRRSVRVSMGQVFAVPYARFDRWPAGLTQLADSGFRLLALTPDPAARPIDEIDIADDAKLALLLGAEGPGLSRQALAACEPVRIPMSRGVDSLNVAAASAVACFALRHKQ
jgi:tRNA G18 (ribose-2'-O)-methylase SpoU